jgi:DUF4097 and DUF4098 domain-containing protein YvlB
MPTFETPEPITATVELDIGAVWITASERQDTVVDVLPSDGAAEADVRAAQQTTVTFAGGKLLVKGPRKRSLFGRSGSLNVTIDLPDDSDVRGSAPLADFTSQGRLGDCDVKVSAGDIQLDEARNLNARTELGDIRVARTSGDAEVVGAGRIDIGSVAGGASIKNRNGDTTIGEVTGDLQANSSNGHITIDSARAGVEAKSANGRIRVGQVERGQVSLQTAAGDLEVGILRATVAWLDLHTRFGTVRNALGPAGQPGPSDQIVEVRARTGLGNITIRHS